MKKHWRIGSLENFVLERDIGTLQEMARACHLQAGFDVLAGLWIHSVDYAAPMLSAVQCASGKDQTRHQLATGEGFFGRKLLLGQLVHYHVPASPRGKFEPSSRPGLFVGWRYDAGPLSHKSVYYVLDYGKLREREAGHANAISVPAEEVYVEEKEPVLPLKCAADLALANFSEASLGEIPSLTFLFQM